MDAFLTLSEFRARTIMPAGDVDSLEVQTPGWTLGQLTSWTDRICSQLRKRYAVPFVAPYPETVKDWLARIVTIRCYLKRGVNPADPQMAVIKADCDDALKEISQAADSEKGLFDLPLRADVQTTSGVVVGGPMFYSEQSPYVWTGAQTRTAMNEDGNSGGTYG